MATTPINNILDWFKTGLKPTQTQFWATLTSYWHKDEQIPQSNISNLTTVLNAKAEKSQFDAHLTDVTAHKNLVEKARIIPAGEVLVFKIPPNENENEKEVGDYCLGFINNVFINGTYVGAGNYNNKSEIQL